MSFMINGTSVTWNEERNWEVTVTKWPKDPYLGKDNFKLFKCRMEGSR